MNTLASLECPLAAKIEQAKYTGGYMLRLLSVIDSKWIVVQNSWDGALVQRRLSRPRKPPKDIYHSTHE